MQEGSKLFVEARKCAMFAKADGQFGNPSQDLFLTSVLDFDWQLVIIKSLPC